MEHIEWLCKYNQFLHNDGSSIIYLKADHLIYAYICKVCKLQCNKYEKNFNNWLDNLVTYQ